MYNIENLLELKTLIKKITTAEIYRNTIHKVKRINK